MTERAARPEPGPLPTSPREAQALAEIGHTDVSRPVAAALLVLFLLTAGGVTGWQVVVETTAAGPPEAASLPAFGHLADGWAGAGDALEEAGPFAANRELLAAISRFEDDLEGGSWLRHRLLPPVQLWTARHLGLGNEQAYLGRDGWLFYRPDVDYAAGPPFLDPAVLARRSLAGETWREPPRPDPVPALIDFRDELAVRGIDLLVVPVPVKPTVHPERLSGRYEPGAAAVQNPSFPALLARLEAAGVDVFDPAPLVVAAAAEEPQYLATDTHWTPAAVDRVAAALARHLEERFDLAEPAGPSFFRRAATVEGRGDIAVMLRLPESQRLYPPERVTVQTVTSVRGDPWRPDRDAAVLLLGDSFTNVYSDPALGFGANAGLAEQLSYHLGRPVDRIAQNAGGAAATRRVLAREVAAGRDRLAGKRLVVYQFAARELVAGDWELVELE